MKRYADKFYKSLQDEIFWSSVLLFFTASVVFGWMGVVLQNRSLTSSLDPLQKQPEALIQSMPLPSVQQPPPPVAQQELQAAVYWLQVQDNAIVLQSQNLAFAPNTPSIDRVRNAIELLLSAPSQSADFSSTIPADTRLLSLTQTGNAIYVDLSAEFAQGGGSSSMIYRVAQILYTTTSIDPDAPVFLSIEGQVLNDEYPLGGEGLLLPSPLTRQQFAVEFKVSS